MDPVVRKYIVVTNGVCWNIQSKEVTFFGKLCKDCAEDDKGEGHE